VTKTIGDPKKTPCGHLELDRPQIIRYIHWQMTCADVPSYLLKN